MAVRSSSLHVRRRLRGAVVDVSGVDVYAMDDGGGVMVNEAASLSAFLQLFDPF